MNGAPIMVIRASRQIISQMGMPGQAMAATSTARLRSQTIITARRGSRSASPDRVTPPTDMGTMLAANVTALRKAECVRANTSRVSATRASWSPATESTCAVHSARNSATRNTPPKVERGTCAGRCGRGPGRAAAGPPARLRIRLRVRSSVMRAAPHQGTGTPGCDGA
jgi:hypothetical protein